MIELDKKFVELGLYRHFKGNEYEVIAIARHSETEEELIVYRAVEGNQDVWVRPLNMWTEMVSQNGKSLPRFEKI